MADCITREQLRELEEARDVDTKEYHRLLKEYAGITAKPYTAYGYYDGCGDYVGDSRENGVLDLLEAAYVEVVDSE